MIFLFVVFLRQLLLVQPVFMIWYSQSNSDVNEVCVLQERCVVVSLIKMQVFYTERTGVVR